MSYPPPGAHFLQNLSAMASMVNMNPAQYQMTPMGMHTFRSLNTYYFILQGGLIPMAVGMPAGHPLAMQASMGITVPTGVTTISAPPVRKLTPDLSSLGLSAGFQQNLINDAQNQQKKKSPSGPTITKCGSVNNWKRVQGANGKLQAFGFCEYSDAESAMRSIRLLHEFEIADKKLVVKVDAKTKEKLDEYVRMKEPDGSCSENVDGLDEEAKKEDEAISTQLTSILREHEIELSRSPDPSREDSLNQDIEKDKPLQESEKDKENTSFEKKDRDKESDQRNHDRYSREKSSDDRSRERRVRNRERTPVKERNSRKDRYDRNDRLDDRNNSDRGIEDEEEAYERRRMERKLREKEASYQERLRNWEARELRKSKDYEKDKSKQEMKRDEESKEMKRLKQFLEDYDDDRDDNKFYKLVTKGSSFTRRLRERQKEKEDDERDQRQEKRELEELRKKLMEEGHPDPESEAKKRLNSTDSERERDKIVSAKIKELMSEARARTGKPVEEEEVSLSGLSEGTPREEIHVKSFTFMGMKIGHSSSSNTQSQTINTYSPADVSNSATGDKRKKLSVQDVFNANDDDDPLSGGKRRKLPSLIDDNTDSNQSELSNTQKGFSDNPKSMSSEEKRKQIKSLIEKIPTSKDELFKYSIDWPIVDNTLMEKRIRPWINKKITEYIGEEEQALLDFICTKLQARSSAQSILDDVAMVLDEEAEVFVVKMWRLLIYEIEAKKLGLGKQ
ncbi:RNA-binding protein 25-like protein [Leptotrombidium deliense]|uniref:RNA-binding protein 25-like protein n=1 Tax=Leptotrombidium deliense TaxID=299467 RepID=A0A443SHL3_9ACAR|nr:RNA-binding protein 25-like protein [Leptotrombidium deliense]